MANLEAHRQARKEEIPNTHGQQHWWCPFHNNVRESRENVCNHGGWTRHSYAVCGPQFNSDTKR